MLKIKLSPRGKKHQITYRIVVTERRSKLNGKFIDDLGFYTPQTNTFEIDKKKMGQWIKNGAQLTVGVDKLLNPKKHPNKKKVKKKKVEDKVEKKVETNNNQAPVKEEVKTTPVETETEEKVEEKKEEKTEEKKEVEVKEDK